MLNSLHANYKNAKTNNDHITHKHYDLNLI